MTKKGYPGLVLVPPSDRTIVRRRIVRWSLVGLAIVWGLFTFLSSLAPPNTSDCQPGDAQTSPAPIQEDCQSAAASSLPPEQRAEQTAPITEAIPTVNPTEELSSPASPSPSPLQTTGEQTTDRQSNAQTPVTQNIDEGHALPAQPETRLTPTQPPSQPTRPNTTADHKAVAQGSNGAAPQQPAPPPHTTPDRKITTQPGNGSVSGQAGNQAQKPTGHSTDHKLTTQAPKELGAQPIPTQPGKAATTITDHKPTGQPGNGTIPNQANTKSVGPTPHMGSDRKVTAPPENGAGQSQAFSQPGKSVNTSTDHKQTAQSQNGSVPHQSSSQAGNPKPSSPDRKVGPQLGNGSVNSLHTAGTANSVAGQAGNRASHDQPSSQSSHEDTRLAEAGDAFAQYRLGRLYAQQGGSQIPEAIKWYKKASNGLRRLAEAGNGQAMYVLGVMYAYGRGVKKDTDQARHWLSQAVSHKITAARPLLANLDRD